MNDPIDQIWTDWRAGRITHDEALRNQAELMPRCATCGQPAPALYQNAPTCPACLARELDVRLPSGESCMQRRRR